MTLQKESGVTLNCVTDTDKFFKDISEGNWERVLSQIAYLSLPPHKLIDLYEQICLELAEGNEHQVALLLIERSSVVEEWKRHHHTRYESLRRILEKKITNINEIYSSGITREKRRLLVIESLQTDIQKAPPSRLTELLTQALRYQSLHRPLSLTSDGFTQQNHPTVELFFDEIDEELREIISDKLFKTLQMGEGATAESLCFSPDGLYLVTGSSDGFIESWDITTGALSTTLAYQSKGQFLMHSSNQTITSLAFAPDGEILATGTNQGEIKIWKYFTGELCWTFSIDSKISITSLSLSSDGSKLLVGTGDGSIRLYGLKSGTIIKTILSATILQSQVTDINLSNVVSSHVLYLKFTSDEIDCTSFTAEGIISSWDLRSGELKNVSTPLLDYNKKAMETNGSSASSGNQQTKMQNTPDDTQMTCCISIPSRPDVFLLASQTNKIILYNPNSKTMLQQYKPNIATSSSAVNTNIILQQVATSQRGKYVYSSASDGIIYCFNFETGATRKAFRAHNSEITVLAHHPFKNILATTSKDGKIKLWN